MTTFLIQVIHLITSLEGSHSGLGWGKHSCFTPKRQNSKEIEVDISIFLSYSVLCWHIVKYSCDFVPVSIFNFVLESFLRLWSCIVLFSPKHLWHTMSSWLGTLRMDLLCLQKCPHSVFLSSPPMRPQITYIKDRFLASAILYSHGASEDGQEEQSLF